MLSLVVINLESFVVEMTDYALSIELCRTHVLLGLTEISGKCCRFFLV